MDPDAEEDDDGVGSRYHALALTFSNSSDGSFPAFTVADHENARVPTMHGALDRRLVIGVARCRQWRQSDMMYTDYWTDEDSNES